jgi:hypothetical protein
MHDSPSAQSETVSTELQFSTHRGFIADVFANTIAVGRKHLCYLGNAEPASP